MSPESVQVPPTELFPELTHDDVFRIETRRLWLRWPRAADVPAIVGHAGERAVAEMTSRIPHPFAPADAEAFVVAARRANAEGRGLVMTVTPRSEPTLPVGVVSIEPDAEGRPSLGYWIAPPAWGRGYATEAARAMIDAYFAYTPGRDLAALVRVVNPASRRVLERCGFAHIGTGLRPFPARGGVFPVDEFRLDRRAWDSLKAWRASGLVIERDGAGGAGDAARAPCHA
jgi:RimJ/RimL family protein N-acetyltransferase